MVFDFLSPIHRATAQVGQHLRPQMTRLGLSNAEGHLLSYLRSYGPCAISVLHRVFGHRRSTLTSMLDRLEEKGVLTRTLCPDDRRSFMVGLTETGVGQAGRVQACLREFEARVHRRLQESDVKGFREVMKAIGQETGGIPEQKEQS
jgi:DNA-binding MarR family transcriptional regulator